MKVEVADGKYTVIQNETGRLMALRYGEEWRDCCGDNLIYSLASELAAIRAEVDAALARVAELEKANAAWALLHETHKFLSK